MPAGVILSDYAPWYQAQLLLADQQQWQWQHRQQQTQQRNNGPLNSWNRMLQMVKPQAGLDSPNDPR